MQSSTFRPAPGLGSPHLQTVWPTLFLRPPPLRLRFEDFELDDGDFLELVWADPVGRPPGERVLVVLHGLEGGWRSPYARLLLHQASQAGWTCVVMQFRGCGTRLNRLDRTYHSGDTGDLRALLSHLRERFGSVPTCAVGYSLGGNVLLKLLGEDGEGAGLEAGAAVSVPLVLSESAARLERGLSQFYQWWFLRTLRRKLRGKFGQRSDPPISLARALTAATMTTFDDAATAPLHGFDSAAHYYADSSSRQYLSAVRVPALIVQARDDPFMTDAVLPEPGEMSDCVTLEVSEHGGHVGFVAHPRDGGFGWLARRLVAFLEEVVVTPPERHQAP